MLFLQGQCYDKASVETNEMKEAIEKKLGLDPVDKHVVVIYEGDKTDNPNVKYWQVRICNFKKITTNNF